MKGLLVFSLVCFVIFLVIFLAVGSMLLKEKSEKQDIGYSKYRIWIGTTAFATGTCIDEYKISKNIIEFTKSYDETKVVSPLSQVLIIEETPCEYSLK